MRAAGAVLGRAIRFSAVPMASVLTPLLVIPIIARTSGAGGLVATSVGQSLGAVIGLVVGLSYPLSGSSRVAPMHRSAQRVEYRRSVESRLVTFVAVAPIGAVISLFAVDSEQLATVLMTTATAGLGFTSLWFYAGVGTTRGLLLWEVLPRVALSAAAAIAMLFGFGLVIYPVALCCAVVFSLCANLRSITGSYSLRINLVTVKDVVRQGWVTSSRLINGVYFVGATSIFALAGSPASVLVFSSMDRVQKSVLNATVMLPQSLLSWISVRPDQVERRQKFAIAADGVLSLLVASSLYVLLPLISEFMFAGLVEISAILRIVVGLSAGAALFSKAVILHGVIPQGGEKRAALMLAIASGFGAVLLFFTAKLAGAVGGLIVVTCVEAAIGVLALWITWRGWVEHGRARVTCITSEQ
jgi:hypothetical protein